MCEAMLQAKQISDGEVLAKVTSKVAVMLSRRAQPDTFAAQATAMRAAGAPGNRPLPVTALAPSTTSGRAALSMRCQ